MGFPQYFWIPLGTTAHPEHPPPLPEFLRCHLTEGSGTYRCRYKYSNNTLLQKQTTRAIQIYRLVLIGPPLPPLSLCAHPKSPHKSSKQLLKMHKANTTSNKYIRINIYICIYIYMYTYVHIHIYQYIHKCIV